jgi:hypothetical protein
MVNRRDPNGRFKQAIVIATSAPFFAAFTLTVQPLAYASDRPLQFDPQKYGIRRTARFRRR